MPEALFDKIYKALIQNKVVCMPTDTIPGFVCKASSDHAVQQIYQLKNRPPAKPLALLVSDLKMAQSYIKIDKNCHKLLNLEHSVSVISPAQLPLQCSRYVNLKSQNLALRIPKNPFLQNLINKIGSALVATSANISGSEPSLSELYKLYQNKLAIYNLTEYNENKEPSAIVNCTNYKPTIVRASAIQKKLLGTIL